MQHSVVVVDDHVLIAEALTGMIKKFKRYTVLYEADNGKALDALMDKGYYYPDWIAHKVLSSLSHEKETPAVPKITLNDREKDFLHYAATELTYKEIAEEMFCSPRTVESYRDNLFEKFGLKT